MAAPDKRFAFGIAAIIVFLTWIVMQHVDVDSLGLTNSHGVSLRNQKDSLWNDLDLEIFNSTKYCGYRKCFFYSKTNVDFGYIVTHPHFIDLDLKAYDLSRVLEKEYAIEQYYLTKPTSVPLNTVMTLAIVDNKRLNEKYHKHEKDTWELVVAKVNTIKNDAVEVGCFSFGKKSTTKLEKALPTFIKKFPNPTDFVETLEKEFETTKKVFRAHPHLYQDLQVMVDKFGNVHHMDFDRAFQNVPGNFTEEWITGCYGNFDKVVRKAQELVDREVEERDFLSLNFTI